jgi:hypothetical protein
MVTRKPLNPDQTRLDRVVTEARRARGALGQSYRGQALNLFPWICRRCARECVHANALELTVQLKNHDHDHNSADGSNRELLCRYCHGNEHQRQRDARPVDDGGSSVPGATHTLFEELASLLIHDD